MIHRSRVAWMGVLLVVLSIAPAGARPILSIGGGVSATDLFLGADAGPTPLGWMGMRGGINDRWSAFMRVGYERPDAPLGFASASCVDCARVVDAEQRVTFVPASCGLRFSSTSLQRAQPFIEVASTVSWSRFERDLDVRDSDGHSSHDVTATEHWLLGTEIGVGLFQALGPGAGMEWGVRYAYTAAPRRSDSITTSRRGGISRIALTAGIAFGR